MTERLVLRNAEVGGRLIEVTIEDGIVAGLASAGKTPSAAPPHATFATIIDCDGGSLLPGLHDHHLHLLAMAAADRSVHLEGRSLEAAIRAAAQAGSPGADTWIRAVGYDESEHGDLERDRLDAIAPDHPVRVQHRSGAMWVLNTPALRRTGATEPDGRLFRRDAWLRSRLPPPAPPDLATVGTRLASYGVTGVTDATPTSDPADFELLAGAATNGALPLAVRVTGGPALSDAKAPEPLEQGPVKVVVTDHELPTLDDLCRWFERARAAGRAVAVHCVTRVALALALAAWDEVGAATGDRVEHGAVVPPALAVRIARHRLTVVTQPAFLVSRGDSYLRNVEPEDREHLYPCGTLLRQGVEVGGSSDAPFGPEDPWLAMSSAMGRQTASGAPIGPSEQVSPRAALALYLSPLGRPGGPPRQIHPGAPADLVLLDAPLDVALAEPSADRVTLTIRAGRITYRRTASRS